MEPDCCRVVSGKDGKARCFFPKENAELSKFRVVNFPKFELNQIGKCYVFFDTEFVSSFPLSAGVALPFTARTIETGPVLMLVMRFFDGTVADDFQVKLEYHCDVFNNYNEL